MRRFGFKNLAATPRALKRVKLSASFALISLFASPASANVIFNWIEVSRGANMPLATSGVIILSDEAVATQSVNLEVYSNPPLVNPPLVSFVFNYGDRNRSNIIQPGFVFGPRRASFNLQLLSIDDLLIGRIDANSGSDEVRMSTFDSSGLWRISALGSDFNDGGCAYTGASCQGTTGYWAGPYSRVPTPSTLALLAICFVGTVLTRKSRVKDAKIEKRFNV